MTGARIKRPYGHGYSYCSCQSASVGIPSYVHADTPQGRSRGREALLARIMAPAQTPQVGFVAANFFRAQAISR